MRRLAVRIVALVALSTLVSCASSPSSEDDEAPKAPLEGEASELLLTEQTPFVLRAELEEGRSFEPMLENAIEDAPMPRYRREKLQDLIDGGPWALLAEPTKLPSTDEIRETPLVWMTGGVVGGDRALRAQNVGLPVLDASEAPTATYVRLVFPAEDSEEFAESLEKSLEEAEEGAEEDESTPPRPHDYDAHNVVAHDAHVQLDLVNFTEDLDEDEVDEVIARIEERRGSSAPETPAFEAFVNAEHPASLYLRTAEMKRFLAATQTLSMTNALATAQSRLRMSIRGKHAGLGTNFEMMAPPSQREYEDAVLLGRARGEDGLAFEVVATRTELGREIYDASATQVEMPAFNTDTLPDERLVADVSWAGDLVAAAQTATPLTGEKVSVDGLREDADDVQSAVPTLQEAARVMGGPLVATGAAHSPTYLLRASLRSLGDELSALVPTAFRGRLVSADSEDAKAPVIGALAIQFPASVDVGEEFSSESGADPEMLEQFGFSQRLVEADDGSAQLHLAFGTSVEDAFLDKSEAVDGDLEFHARAREIEGHEEEVERLESVASSLDFRGAHTSTVGHWGLSVGSIEEEDLEELHAEGELAENGPDCLTDVVWAGPEVLEASANFGSSPSVRSVKSALDKYDEAADACADKAPGLDERLDWAKARARWQLADLGGSIRLDRTRETVEQCREEDDEDACREITGEPAEEQKAGGGSFGSRGSEGHDLDELDRLYTLAVDLYEDACDGGVQPACDDLDDLPERDDILWTPE